MKTSTCCTSVLLSHCSISAEISKPAIVAFPSAFAFASSALRPSESSAVSASLTAFASFLNSFPIAASAFFVTTYFSTLIGVSSGADAVSDVFVKVPWHVRSYADRSAMPTHSTHPIDISISASQQSHA